MKRITEEDLPPLTNFVTGVPPVVQELLNTLAARNPKFRYATADQLLADLQALRSGGTMEHMQTLRLQQAAQGPASASAADLTRSPTGPSPAMKSSLVDELIDDAPRTTAPVHSGGNIEIPWMGIFVTAMVLLFAALGMLYYKGWEASQPAEAPAVTGAQEGAQPPPRRADGPRPDDGTDRIRPQHRPPPHPPHLGPRPGGGQRPAPPPQ